AAAAEAHEDARAAGAHQGQRRGVRGAAADDDGDVELVNELLEVERLGAAGDVLGGDRRAADHEDVRARVEHRLVVTRRALRRQGRRGDDTSPRDLLDAPADQLFLDRLRVDLL